ncbi:MerR family transcriptional regulator [Pseudonocardia humida]|uniref:MerR family transcriptional regulator n=1 Tax=Pseudonocardia humida TaxID=2800819 RepID=A0ABT1AA70_9PSEU|nr:MerR family transcriptional regulator [Pseudonocardia humida]MCO1659956.1 MerR family transcriptional regulator [Pseudonocardia humida]
MWRIGQVARMAGVSARTLRHYDRIGLLAPAAVGHATGYRWYGVAELARLERIRGLQRLGLPLHRIVEVLDAPDAQVRQALQETVAVLHDDIAALTATAARAAEHLAAARTILPQQPTVGARRLRMHRVRVEHPAELAGMCGGPETLLLTWLDGPPEGGFTAAWAGVGGEPLTLPVRDVARTIVPAGTGVVRAGRELFDWVDRQGLAVAGPTLEEHLVDGDGARAAALEVPVRPTGGQSTAPTIN